MRWESESRLQQLRSQDLRTIEAEERLANTIRQKGGRENSRASLEILSRVHAWKHAKFGAEHRKTLETAGYLSNALRDAGRVEDAEALQRVVTTHALNGLRGATARWEAAGAPGWRRLFHALEEM